jgi:TPR repeat protein
VKTSALQTSDLWREWYSDHLTLDSDVDVATATALLSEFERSVEAFDALFLSDVARPRTRLRVVLFAQFRDYWALGSHDTPGLFTAEEPDYESSATIFLPTRDTYRATVVAFQHELTHRHVNASMPQAPGWLDEGLAELWQSLQPGDRDSRLGYLPPPLGDRDVDKLMRPDDRLFHWVDLRRGNYQLAGAFVEFLWLEQHDAFLRYLHALAGGAAVTTAWQESFPQPVATGFETWYRAVKRGSGNSDVTVEHFAFLAPEPRPPSSVRPLAMAELLRLFAALDLQRNYASTRVRAATWATASVLVAPFDADAWYWAGIYANKSPEVDGAADGAYETALALQPDHVRALAALTLDRFRLRADVGDFSEVDPLVTRIPPRSSLSNVLWVLALYAHARGRDDDAFGYMKRELQAKPGCTGCSLWMASLHNVRGEIADAEREIERAIAMTPEAPVDAGASLKRTYAEARTNIADCNHGDAAACERLSHSYGWGRGVPLDAAVALDLARRACDGKQASACRTVAAHLRHGIRPDPERSTALMRHACVLGDWEACNDLGDAYEHGVGVAADVTRAAGMYKDACAHDSAWGCVSLASLAWRELGGLTHNEAQIAAWLERALKRDKTIASTLASGCPLHTESCALAGIVWLRGLGVEKNADYARDLMGLGCAAGDAAACRARSAQR